MATTTTDFFIRPEDGWTLVATAPNFIQIKPSTFHPWQVAVAASLPAATQLGMSFGKDTSHQRAPFECDNAITGNVYIRVNTPIAREPVTQKAHFSVLADV